MSYTKSELDSFMASDDIEFSEYQSTVSIKSNIFLFSRNFLNLGLYLSKLKAYVKQIDNNSGPNSALRLTKTIILIDSSVNIGESYQVTSDNISYKVERLNQYVIEITNITVPQWNTDELLIQIKSVNGMLIYPAITTAENKIKIDFIDGLVEEYKVFII